MQHPISLCVPCMKCVTMFDDDAIVCVNVLLYKEDGCNMSGIVGVNAIYANIKTFFCAVHILRALSLPTIRSNLR